MLFRESLTVLESTNHLITIGQVLNPIATTWMSSDWEYPAIDPKASNIIFRTTLKCSAQRIGVLQAESIQLEQGIRTLQPTDGSRCGRRELDRLTLKLTANPKVNVDTP